MPSSTTINSGEPVPVLCLAPNWLGDAVLARAALARLGRAGCAVEVWARPRVRRVLEDLPGVSVAAAAPASRAQRFAAAIRRRRRGRDAAGLVLSPAWSAAAAAWLAGARVRVGFATDARRMWLTHAPPAPARSIHLSDQYDTLVATLAAALERPLPAMAPAPPLVARAGERTAASALAATAGFGADYVVLLPGARYGPAKRWPAERFAATGAALHAAWNCAVVLAGEVEDAPATAAVRAALPVAVDLAGRTPLPALVGLLAGARAVVANDSGGMHLAAALGRPVVGIFGSSDPGWTGPRGAHAHAVVQPVWCAPCFAPHCRQDFACMLGITPERVAAAVHAACGDPSGMVAGREC
jgi:heptosyltransferase-2